MTIRSALLCVLVALAWVATGAQSKVAEGEYQFRSSAGDAGVLTRPVTRWAITSAPSGGFHLESEIQSQPTGLRVLQVEDLNPAFQPAAIGFEIYLAGQNTPDVTARCEIAATVACKGASGPDQAAPSAPFHPAGPFWLWMDGFFSVDFPWLLEGAIQSAHPENGKISVATLSVSGGASVKLSDAVKLARVRGSNIPVRSITPGTPIDWQLTLKDPMDLEFIGQEPVDVNGTSVMARHFKLTAGPKTLNLWMAGPGIVVRLNSYYLTNYKQHQKLIPELPVDNQAPPPQK